MFGLRSSRPLILTAAAFAVSGSGALAIGNHFMQKQTLHATSAVAAAATSNSASLNMDNFKPFKVQSVEQVTHDTKRLRFELKQNERLGLPVASAVLASVQPKNASEPIVRPYTPTSPSDATGYFELVVKIYPQGQMTPHINNLKPGDTLDFKGPLAKVPISRGFKKAIGMIAGGTGITPMYQVIQEVLKFNDGTQLTLLFANKSEEDIILKQELDALAAKYKNFKVHYIVEKPQPGWKGSVGFVNEDLIKSHLPNPAPDHLILVCGPPGMMNAISGNKAPDYSQGELSGALKKLGYAKDSVFKF